MVCCCNPTNSLSWSYFFRLLQWWFKSSDRRVGWTKTLRKLRRCGMKRLVPMKRKKLMKKNRKNQKRHKQRFEVFHVFVCSSNTSSVQNLRACVVCNFDEIVTISAFAWIITIIYTLLLTFAFVDFQVSTKKLKESPRAKPSAAVVSSLCPRQFLFPPNHVTKLCCDANENILFYRQMAPQRWLLSYFVLKIYIFEELCLFWKPFICRSLIWVCAISLSNRCSLKNDCKEDTCRWRAADYLDWSLTVLRLVPNHEVITAFSKRTFDTRSYFYLEFWWYAQPQHVIQQWCLKCGLNKIFSWCLTARLEIGIGALEVRRLRTLVFICEIRLLPRVAIKGVCKYNAAALRACLLYIFHILNQKCGCTHYRTKRNQSRNRQRRWRRRRSKKR